MIDFICKVCLEPYRYDDDKDIRILIEELDSYRSPTSWICYYCDNVQQDEDEDEEDFN